MAIASSSDDETEAAEFADTFVFGAYLSYGGVRDAADQGETPPSACVVLPLRIRATFI